MFKKIVLTTLDNGPILAVLTLLTVGFYFVPISSVIEPQLSEDLPFIVVLDHGWVLTSIAILLRYIVDIQTKNRIGGW